MGNRVQLQFPNNAGSGVEFEIDYASLGSLVVHTDRVGPDTLAWSEPCGWVNISDEPDLRHLGSTLQVAIKKLGEGNPAAAREYCGRVLRFGRGNLAIAEVRLAHFLLGHLAQCAKRYAASIAHYQYATREPLNTRVLAAAHSNAGVAWAWLENAAAALEQLLLARRLDPNCLPARLSLLNLAESLQHAPNVAGYPSWQAIAEEERTFLAKLPGEAVKRFLNPRRDFPTYHLYHIFPLGPHGPGLAASLPDPDAGRKAAIAVLQHGEIAFSHGTYHRAAALAARAGKASPSVSGYAQALEARATAKIRENEALAHEAQFHQALCAFDDALRSLCIENLEAAREPFEILTTFLDSKEQEHFAEIYRRRVEQVIAQEYWKSTDPERKARLNIIRKHYAVAHCDAYERAAAYGHAMIWLAEFGAAIDTGHLTAAEEALCKIRRHLDPSNPSVRLADAIVEDLRRLDVLEGDSQSNPPPLPSG